MAKKEKESEAKPITRSVILQPEIDAKLMKLAEEQERSISFMISKAVREMLDRDASQAEKKS